MKRWALLTGAGTLALCNLPRRSHAQPAQTLRFVPQADLPGLDPIASTATVTRNHGYLVYDTLYGLDEAYQPHPQMVAAHDMQEDGRRWRLKLRESPRFHDGQPVLARDCVASIRRWAARDSFGGIMLAAIDPDCAG